MRGKKGFLIFILWGVVFFLAGWLTNTFLGFSDQSIARRLIFINKETSYEERVDFKPFWQVLDKLSEKYLRFSEVEGDDLLYGAISGLVKGLGDPYTAFFNPEENASVKEEVTGSYEGIGVEFGFRGEKMVIIAPLNGSPAAKVGIKAGDEIVKIDGQDTQGMSLPQAANLIKGPAGTDVALSLKKEGEEGLIEATITRKKIYLESIKVEKKEGLSYIRVVRFYTTTNEDWDEAVEEVLSEENLKGVILDLRNNPGGYLNSSIYIASEFLSSGTVLQEELARNIRKSFPVERKGAMVDIPLVVLINKGSASASEIIAGALQERKRAKLVGETSFGKGTVQEVFEFEDKSGLHVTIAKWLLPSGKSIDGIGLVPDYEVLLTEEDIKEEQDPQLDKAIEALKEINQ